MRPLAVAVWLCIMAATAAQAGPPPPPPHIPPPPPPPPHHVVPAPEIDAGIPALLAVGGVLLGAQLLRRRRLAQAT